MKKILIATTALVATAGMAAAEITFSGGGRFGVKHTGSIAAGADTAGKLDANGASIVGGGAVEGEASDNAGVGLIRDQLVVDIAARDGLLVSDANYAAKAKQVTTTEASLLAAQGALGAAKKDSKADLTNRFTINIMGTAETDSGIEFFGKVRIRGGNEGNGATSGSAISAPRLGATIGGLTVAVGNINGAIDSLPGMLAGSVGLTGLGYSNNTTGGFDYDGFSSGGGGVNGVEVIYSANGLGVHLSHSDQAAAARTALGINYAFGDWKVAMGIQESDLDAEDFTTINVTGAIGSVSVGASYSAMHASIGDGIRVNAGFEVGAGTNVTVYIADTDGAPDTAYGLGFTHSLGGATLAGGIASNNIGTTSADLGVRFSF